MEHDKDAAKAAKKAAKAQAKGLKKLDKKHASEPLADGAAARQVPSSVTASGMGPAERSAAAAERAAAAAERQAGLQRYRVLFALLMVALSLAALLVTVKPWRFLAQPEPGPETSSSIDEGSP